MDSVVVYYLLAVAVAVRELAGWYRRDRQRKLLVSKVKDMWKAREDFNIERKRIENLCELDFASDFALGHAIQQYHPAITAENLREVGPTGERKRYTETDVDMTVNRVKARSVLSWDGKYEDTGKETSCSDS